MSEIAEIINSLENRLGKLLGKIDSLEKNSIHQEIELQNALAIIQKQSDKIQQSQSECQSLKMANSLLGGDENKRDTKLKINSLIREIDYCITQLSD